MTHKYYNDENSSENVSSEEFKKNHIKSIKYYIIFAILLLIIGFIGFFQICSVQAGWCNGIGLAGSSEEDGVFDSTQIAILEFIFLCFIIVGTAVFIDARATKGSRDKLIKNKKFSAAHDINGNNTVTLANKFYAAETKEYMNKYEELTGDNVVLLNPSLLDEYNCENV